MAAEATEQEGGLDLPAPRPIVPPSCVETGTGQEQYERQGTHAPGLPRREHRNGDRRGDEVIVAIPPTLAGRIDDSPT